MPQVVWSVLPPNVQVPEHLAYIELFTPFTAAPHYDHRMYSVKRCFGQDGDCLAIIVPLSSLHSSMHLYPQFGPVAPCNWTSSTVLNRCHNFYVSPLSSHYAYFIIQ